MNNKIPIIIAVASIAVFLVFIFSENYQEYKVDSGNLTDLNNTESTDIIVDMLNSEFIPSDIQLNAGETVEFVNKDSYSHTVHITDQSGENVFPDTSVPAGGSVKVTLQDKGTYQLNCEIHPGMDGSITVS